LGAIEVGHGGCSQPREADRARVNDQMGVENLEGDGRFAEADVVGQLDHAKAAAAQFTDDAVITQGLGSGDHLLLSIGLLCRAGAVISVGE
jgi:hypothetical protein